MTYKHYNAVAERMPEGVETATERALLLDACYLADSKGVLRMSQIELSQVTLWSLATVKRVFTKLEEIGLLLRLKHGRYQVNVSTGGITSSRVKSEAGSLNQELVKWIKKNFDEDTFADKELYLTETEEDETVIQQAITTGLLVELRKEDRVGDGEPGTIYKLNF